MIFVTDEEQESKDAANVLSEKIPESWNLHHIQLGLADILASEKEYSENAQLLIAQLVQTGLEKARGLHLENLLIVEPDLIPPPNALKVLRQALEFDDGYYSVSQAAYVSQGGGSFMGGWGTYNRQILADYLPEERELSDKCLAPDVDEKERGLDKRWKAAEKQKAALKKNPSEEQVEEWVKLDAEVEKRPPKADVFTLNGKYGWRHRGWFDQCYPGIGKGCIVPVKWVGMGCILLDKRALDLADLHAYEGRGTQDLHLVWNCWHPAGLRLCAVPHLLCDHVVREIGEDGRQDWKKPPVLMHAYHETDPAREGHLRISRRKFYDHSPGQQV